MLAGEAPFRGSNTPSVLRKVVHDPPEPPSRVVAEFVKKPAGLETCADDMKVALESLCLKALAKKREDRPQSLLDFAEALEAWIQASKDPSARTTEIRGYFKKRRMSRVAIASVPLLALVLFMSWRFRPAQAHPTAGDEIAAVASGFLSSKKWTSFGEAVIELRRNAPAHPQLREFAEALPNPGTSVQKHPNETTS